MRYRVFLFHYRFAKSFAEFVTQKYRVVAETVGASVFVNNLSVSLSAAAYITSVGIAQYHYALKVRLSVDNACFCLECVELVEKFFVVVSVVARLARIARGIDIRLAV